MFLQLLFPITLIILSFSTSVSSLNFSTNDLDPKQQNLMECAIQIAYNYSLFRDIIFVREKQPEFTSDISSASCNSYSPKIDLIRKCIILKFQLPIILVDKENIYDLQGFFIIFTKSPDNNFFNEILLRIKMWKNNRFVIVWVDYNNEDLNKNKIMDFFLIFFKFHIISVVLLLNKQNVTYVYSCYPFNTNVILFDIWDSKNKKFKIGINLYDDENKFKDMNGHSLKCLTKNKPPDSVVYKRDNHWVFHGLGVNLLFEVSKKMNFTPDIIIPVPDNEQNVDRFGYDVSPNMNTVIIGALTLRDVDLAFGVFSHLSYFNPSTEYSATATEECYTFAVPSYAGKPTSVWSDFIKEFELVVWILIIITFILHTSIWYVVCIWEQYKNNTLKRLEAIQNKITVVENLETQYQRHIGFNNKISKFSDKKSPSFREKITVENFHMDNSELEKQEHSRKRKENSNSISMKENNSDNSVGTNETHPYDILVKKQNNFNILYTNFQNKFKFILEKVSGKKTKTIPEKSQTECETEVLRNTRYVKNKLLLEKAKKILSEKPCDNRSQRSLKKTNEIHDKIKMDLIQIIFFKIALTLGSPSLNKVGNKFIMRFLVMQYVVFCFITSQAYLGSLGSFMTYPNERGQVNHPRELYRLKWKLTGPTQAKKILERAISNGQILQKLSERFIIYQGSYEELLLKIGKARNLYTFAAARFLQFYINNNQELKNSSQIENTIYLFPRCTYISYSSPFLFQKGSPLINPVNKILGRIIESGITKKWIDTATPKKIIIKRDPVQRLDMNQILGCFIMLIILHCTSILVFLAELFIYRIQKMKIKN